MQLLRNSLVSGVTGSAATLAAAALLARKEGEPAVAPINAISHILFGEHATKVGHPDVKHTATGALLNTGAIVGWAMLHEAMFGRKRKPSLPEAILTGATVSAVAYVVDYHVVPKRLTPGFEERLSRGSLFGVFATLAATLCVGAILRR